MIGGIARSALRAVSLPSTSAWDVHFEAMRRVRAGMKVIVLSIGEPDAPTTAGAEDATIAAVRDGAGRHYSEAAGSSELREAIAHYYRRRLRAAHVQPQHVFVTSGAQNAIFQMLQCVLDEGSEVVTPDPGYVTYENTIVSSGGVVRRVLTRASENFGLRVDDVAASINRNTRAVLLTTPNNPTGRVLSAPELERLAQLCHRRGVWLISDEVYAQYTGERSPFTSASALPQPNTCISIGSVSKTFSMVGWRIGWAVLPPEPALLHGVMRATGDAMLFGVSPIAERGALHALRQGLDGDGAELSAPYLRRAAVLREALDFAVRAGDLHVQPTQGGMFSMIDVSATRLSAQEFSRRLLDRHAVSVLPGDAFGAAGRGHVRASLTVDADVLREAARRIALCAREARREQTPVKSTRRSAERSAEAPSPATVKASRSRRPSVLMCTDGPSVYLPFWHSLANALQQQLYHDASVVVLPHRGTGSGQAPEATTERAELDDRSFENALAAVVWQPSADVLKRMPRLALVQAVGAGVDGMAGALRDVPPSVPVARLVAPAALRRIQSYVLAAAMNHVQRSVELSRAQRACQWRTGLLPDAVADTCVGILGAGEFGRAAAERLARAGFEVRMWSRSSRVADELLVGVSRRYIGGRDVLYDMAAESNVLVCLLPLLDSTRGVLDSTLFGALPAGATLVNCARGAHLSGENELISALRSGQLRAAVLDVFEHEPLPQNSLLWNEPGLVVTPHIAGESDAKEAASTIADNVRKVLRGEPPLHLVDRQMYAL